MSTSDHPRALALVGMPGTGKTLCAKHLEQRGYFQFRFGGIVTDEVARRGLPLNPENERIVREELRKHEGMDAMAKLALPRLRDALETHRCIVIDGLYSFSEYKTLHKAFGGKMIVIAIASPRAARYERLKTREHRPLTPEEAERRDFQEIETLEKGGPIAIADYTLVNNGQETALLDKLEGLLNQLGMRP